MPKGVTPADGTVKPCYRRASVRFLLTILILCGCQENGAAVSVRWLIVDLSTGGLIKPNDKTIAQSDGSCGIVEPDASVLPTWRIEEVRLVIADPVTGSEVLADGGASTDKRLLFTCTQREGTTPFSLPPGTFALSLRAVNGGVDDPSVVTAAPSVRTLKAAEVVNLDVEELGIHPVRLAPFDLGAPDLSSPETDMGPVP